LCYVVESWENIVTIAPALRHSSYQMNEAQRTIVEHQRGPLLIIAGPGSGKTRSLTLLAMNLLLRKQAQPSELLQKILLTGKISHGAMRLAALEPFGHCFVS
jgi:predicted NACHT family NTPase